MPIYEYQCQSCGSQTEVMQRMSDPPLATCDDCGGPLKKLISAPAFQFKGSGWYVTDYARSGNDKAKAEGKSEAKGEGKGDGGKEPAGEKAAAAGESKTTSTESKSSGESKSSSGENKSSGPTAA